jgi:hypothetical protein
VRHTNCAAVLAAYKSRGPSTADEIEAFTGLPHQIVSARTTDLRRRKKLIPTGKRRNTRLGRPAQVLRAVSK